jgi:hypothetical protein
LAQKKTSGKPPTVDLKAISFSVEEAPEWSNLFYRKSGWFGGDGIFALTLNGIETPGTVTKRDSILLWFSDTMLGEITNDSLQPGYVMIHNSLALLHGNKVPRGRGTDKINFLWKQDGGKPESVFVPRTPATQPEDYYWLGDGFVNHAKQNDIYIFGYRIKDTGAGGAFGFAETGNTLIVIPQGQQPPFIQQRQMDIPFFKGTVAGEPGSFGAGVLVNTKEAGAANPDGYIYIYGVWGQQKNVVVARVLPGDIENFPEWTFWNGEQWTSDVNKVAPVTSRASNELSITQLPDGRYALIFQTDGVGKQVALRLGASPVGPFGPVIPLWDCSKDVSIGKNFFCYNAKAHPVLSGKNDLLISYNINSFDFFNDIKVHPNLYRPRFIRVKFK